MSLSFGQLCKSVFNFIERPGLRYRWIKRGRHPTEARTLAQRLEELKYEDPTLHYKVNIGLPLPHVTRKDVFSGRLKHHLEVKANKELELASKRRTLKVELEDVHEEWTDTVAAQQVHQVAQYYNVYEDLFGEAYFYPVVPLKISFDYEKDESLITPVYRGNLIKPLEASKKPDVHYPAADDELYTLVLTTPDCHLTEEKGEYLHWFVGNIPGNQREKGEELCDYLQPFPPKGVGYCRYIFVLYKQNKKIDFSKYRRALPCTNLTARTFSTYDFYRDLQDFMTPAGVSFFQSDWDPSLTNLFHKILDMKEPIVEYDFDPLNLPKQQWYPHRKPFNIYLDKFKEPKQLQKELLIEKLKERHPFKPPAPRPKYPLAFNIDRDLPSWKQDDIRRKRMREGKWKFM